MTQHPLPVLPRSQTYEAEFGAVETLITASRSALSQRPEPYARELGDTFLDMGLQLGQSAAKSCAALCSDLPFWGGVCVRVYFEFSLRLLWASREPDGTDRLYSHYSKQHLEFVEALAKADSRYSAVADEFKSLPQRSELPDAMPYPLPKVIRAIAEADKAEGIVSLFADPAYYNETIHLLHMFAHANPLHLGGERTDYTPHAAHSLTEATCALLRAVGYRLGWDQKATVARVYAIPSLESLSDEDRERLLGERS